jgi:hypothetical protein
MSGVMQLLKIDGVNAIAEIRHQLDLIGGSHA